MNNEPKFTKGPWTMSINGEIKSGRRVIAKLRANGPTFGSPDLEDIATGKLLLSAPDLYAALERLLLAQVEPSASGLIAAQNQARAALAKAQGKGAV